MTALSDKRESAWDTNPAAHRRSLRTPAKINLGLRLLGVRDDGYHTLESVFAPIQIYDDLEIEILPEKGDIPDLDRIELEVRSPDQGELPAALSVVPAGPDNLVVRAATAFCKETGFEARIRLRLLKRIPAGAGMGGGSSDAGAVLRGLASLLKTPIRPEALHALALGLGADVPFFLSPAPALVSGIGETIECIDGLPPLDLVVVNPGISLATAEVYRATDVLRSGTSNGVDTGAGNALTEPEPGSTMRAISRLRGETGNLAPALGDLLINDLEPAARRLCPPVARLSDGLLRAGAIGVSMSGSGATVFGVFQSADQASRAAESLRASQPTQCWIRVTQMITSGSA